MQVKAQGYTFEVQEAKPQTDGDEVHLTVSLTAKPDICRHIFQDSTWDRNPDGSLTDSELAKLGAIAAEDHLDFCLGRTVIPEPGIMAELLGES